MRNERFLQPLNGIYRHIIILLYNYYEWEVPLVPAVPLEPELPDEAPGPEVPVVPEVTLVPITVVSPAFIEFSKFLTATIAIVISSYEPICLGLILALLRLLLLINCLVLADKGLPKSRSKSLSYCPAFAKLNVSESFFKKAK